MKSEHKRNIKSCLGYLIAALIVLGLTLASICLDLAGKGNGNIWADSAFAILFILIAIYEVGLILSYIDLYERHLDLYEAYIDVSKQGTEAFIKAAGDLIKKNGIKQ